jgi:uncharacterized protein YjiS (DUF1127 family)
MGAAIRTREPGGTRNTEPTEMTASSPIPAADPTLHTAPRLKPIAVRRHDMWAHPVPGAPTTRRHGASLGSGPSDPEGARSANRDASLPSGPTDPKEARSANREVQQAATSSNPSGSWWKLLAGFAGWPVHMLAVAWRLQGEIRDLNVLDDHLLADMGVTRSELRTALRKSAYPQPVYSAKPGDFGHP